MENMSFNNILLDSIAKPFDIILTSITTKANQQNKNVSENSISSKNNKLYIATIEDYISKKHDEVAPQHLKQELMNKTNNEVPCKSAVNSNESFVTSLKKHIKSFPSEIYFLREEIRQKKKLHFINISKKNKT